MKDIYEQIYALGPKENAHILLFLIQIYITDERVYGIPTGIRHIFKIQNYFFKFQPFFTN